MGKRVVKKRGRGGEEGNRGEGGQCVGVGVGVCR